MDHLQELLNLTKENEWENSSAYLQVSSLERQQKATAENTYLLLTMERDFNEYMKKWLSRAYAALVMRYNINPDTFHKIEFWELEDDTIWVLVKNTDNNKLYSVILNDFKNGDKRDFTVVSVKEIE